MPRREQSSDVTIRPARRGEERAVRGIERAAQGLFADSAHPHAAELQPLSLNRLRWMRRCGWLLVAADAADRPVGFIACSLVDGDAFVEEVDVLPEWGGRRIGARLIDAVADVARARGVGRLTLTTFADVPWNAPYYRRLGFRVLAETDWGPELAERVAEEDESGLDRAARVAMVRDVPPHVGQER